MKTKLLVTVLIIASPLLVIAQPKGGNGGMRGGGMGQGMGLGRGQVALEAATSGQELKKDNLTPLKSFVNLSDKQLLAIRDVIDQILKMSPQEREALKKKIAEYEKLDPSTQRMIRQGWGHVSENYKRDWRTMMQSLPDQERQHIQTKMQELSYDERNEYRMKLIDEWKAKQTEASGK